MGNEKKVDVKRTEGKSELPESTGRRSLLRGSVTALPALLTLQSGAALARSSNLIAASSTPSPDRKGRTLCLDTNSVMSVDGSNTLFDVGEPAYGRVSAINDRQYHAKPRSKSRQISEAEMCDKGGVYYYKDRRRSWGGGKQWQKVHVKKGVLVSATALTSFGSEIHVYDL